MTVQLYKSFILVQFFKYVKANYPTVCRLNVPVLAARSSCLDTLSWLLHKASQ